MSVASLMYFVLTTVQYQDLAIKGIEKLITHHYADHRGSSAPAACHQYHTGSSLTTHRHPLLLMMMMASP
jgi:hypothetical protein